MQWPRSVALILMTASVSLAGCAGTSVPQPPTSAPVISPAQTPSASSPPPAAVTPVAATEAELWSQLRQGGYVILFRHALAPGTGDPPNFRLDDCSTQRNLSATGQQQAIDLGERLRQQNIAVSRVLSSQWCRCLETARLMNVGQVEPFPVLNSFFQDRSSQDSQTEQLRKFILENRDSPGVIVMVTHQVNITAISSITPQSGAAVVLRASPEQVELVGQLNPL
jgi:phosphohistidine phosphatase SixA